MDTCQQAKWSKRFCQILILNDGMSAERFVLPVSWLTNMTCHFCRCEFRMFRISSLLRIMLCDLMNVLLRNSARQFLMLQVTRHVLCLN